MGYDSWAKEVVARLADNHSSVPDATTKQLAGTIAKLGAQKLTQGQRTQFATTLLESLAKGEGAGGK